MAQTSFDPVRPLGLPGEFVRGETFSMLNPVLPQITELDMSGGTTDGTYTCEIRERSGGPLIASFSYVASSKTAAQIAAGLSAAALADPVVRGLLNATGSDVTETDSANLYFRQSGQSYHVAMTSDPSSGVVVSNRQDAGFTAVDPGDLIQSDDAGGFEQWDGDGPAFLGIVLRMGNVTFPSPTGLNSNAADADIDGPNQIEVLYDGEAYVQLADGETVAIGDGPAAYDDATKTWKKAAGGDWVVVEGSQWRSSGSGVQKVFVRGPLHA